MDAIEWIPAQRILIAIRYWTNTIGRLELLFGSAKNQQKAWNFQVESVVLMNSLT